LESLQRYGPITICGLVGFLSAFTISLGGQMPVSELILMVIFPWVLMRAYYRREWPSRLLQLGWFHLLLLLWGFTAAGYVVSDLYRETPFDNLIRGWARVGFLLIDLVSIAYLVDSSWSRLRLLVLALYAGRVLEAIIYGPLYGQWWKFGVGYALTLFGLFAMAGRSLMLQAFAAGGLGILNLLLGARSLGATCFLIAWVFFLYYARGVWRPILVMAAIASMVGVLYLGLGDNEMTAGSNVERRSMVEIAGELFIDSPVVGQGSWFTATSMLGRLEARRTALDSRFGRYTEEEARKISIHSQLLTALAEAGIFGGAFFLGLGMLVLKTTRTLIRHAMPYRAFILYLVVAGGWNLLMTPFSGVVRVEIAILVGACLLVILQRQGELEEDFRE
jgi:hypothetical protein